MNESWEYEPAGDRDLAPLKALRSSVREPGLVGSLVTRIWSRLAFGWLRWYQSLTVEGQTQLPADPPFVLVANHTIGEDDALMQPIFLDHHGHFQAMVDPHPTSRFLREPVKIRVPVLAQPLAF